MPIRKRGKAWEYYFDIGKDENGKRKRKSKGGFTTKKECEEALLEAQIQYKNTGRIINDKNLSIDQYLKYWYDNYVLLNCRYRTQVEYKRIIDTNIIPYLGGYYLKDISPAKVKEFLDQHYLRDISKKTMEGIFNVIKYSLDMAVFPYELIKENTCKYIKLKYKFKPPKTNRITIDDAKNILNYLKENYRFSYYIPFLIMYNTGVRKSECFGLQWDDIDIENKVMHIHHQSLYKDGKMLLVECKTPSSVGDILLGDTLINELMLYKEIMIDKNPNNSFVCLNTEMSPITNSNFGWICRKIYNTINIRVSAHSFRYLHGQVLLENKASIKAIQGRLRHANVKTTLQTYLKSSNKLEEIAVNIWEDVL